MRFHKKVSIAFLLGMLILAALMGLAGCASDDNRDNDSIVGEWQVFSGTENGAEIIGDTLASYEYTISFIDESTAAVTLFGTVYESSYHIDEDTVAFDNPAIAALLLTKSGSTLMYDDAANGVVLTFVKG